MKCFLFTSEEKKVENGTTQSISFQSNASTTGTKSGSEFNSNTSAESLVRPSYPSFSRRPNIDVRVFTFSELKSATKNFSRSAMLGEGGFGCVYLGVIKSPEDKKVNIAVKKLGGRGIQRHKEWVTEVNVLGVVSHPNLVKLLGYCAEDDERGIQRLLVYEYMPNGSVDDHLFIRSKTILPWSMRLKIAQDAARGLTHLHEDMAFQIIFRDFKSSNILLDENWDAKLSDFGLARLGPSDGLTHVSTAVVGTMGYAAPEYVQTGRLTSKSDVWSYGVFLLELITGRRPLDRNRPKSEQKLLVWVKPYLTDAKKFKHIIDPRLEGNYSIQSVQKLANLVNQCLARNPKLRPKMSDVLETVKEIAGESEGSRTPQQPMKMNLDSNKDDSRWSFRAWISKLSKPR